MVPPTATICDLSVAHIGGAKVGGRPVKVSFIIVRAVLALLFAIGFYVLALGIALGLFWVPYAEFAYAQHITPKLAVICILGGLAIVWSVLPRPDKFSAPGPLLKRQKQPRLFAALGRGAKASQP